MGTAVKIRNKGFSLIEMLIVIVIIGILSSIAIPAFQSFVFTSRIATYTSALHGALLLARSEAIKRGLPVVLCRSTTSETTTPTCTNGSSAGANTGWGDGWIIFADANNDGAYQASDVLIAVKGALITNVTGGSIIPSPVNDVIVFRSTGQLVGAFMRFQINRPNADARAADDRFICLGVGGRARVATTVCTLD